ncbi:MAG: PilT/PilU family type 4a pilus ATPase [Victivallaceae bacterium]
MNLDVQWFIYALVKNEVISLDECKTMLAKLGGGIDLPSFAQEILNHLASEINQEEAEAMLSQFEAVMEFAYSRAQKGVPPDIFEDETQGSWDDLPSLENVSSMSDQQVRDLMTSLLKSLRALGASDLHISANAVPFIRRALKIEKLSSKLIPPEDAIRLNTVLLNEEQKEYYEKEMDLNFALEIEHSRFRVSLMIHKDGSSGSYRLVPGKIKSLQELGFLPTDVKTIERLLDYHNGLILVTGPIGCGKTTTLASMVDIINHKRHDHVITVEDPIEIIQESDNCNVTQREVGKHTNSYSSALKGALREDPDIIVIGELHDLDTIENGITASETGHLVIGTLHTCDAANTLNRILDVFPPMQQPQIRAMTAGSLRGIICQRLIPAVDGNLTVAYELLINNMAVGNIIDEGKTYQLKAVMQTGSKAGMCTFDHNILNKFKAGQITAETAREYIKDKSVMQLLNQDVAVSEAKKLGKK